MENTKTLLDALINADETKGDVESTYAIMLPILEYYKFGADNITDLHDVKLCGATIPYVPHYITACHLVYELTDKRSGRMSKCAKTDAAIFSNLLTRLVKAKYDFEESKDEEYLKSITYEISYEEDIKGYRGIAQQFEQYIEDTIFLCRKEEFYDFFARNLITKGIFYNDYNLKGYGITMAKSLEDKYPDLYTRMKDRIEYYSLLNMERGWE